MSRPDEPRSNLSVGLSWAARVTSVGLEFALPPVLGAWLDGWWGTSPWALLAGTASGFALGMAHTLRIAREGAGR